MYDDSMAFPNTDQNMESALWTTTVFNITVLARYSQPINVQFKQA